jgi:2-amino-4-hydroxy-6-hydroxymethyldihydropteridine diphosphokinase
MSEKTNIAFIGIGANKGDRQKTCLKAVDAFYHWRQGKVMRASSLYETEPWGYKNQELFINCVIKIATALDAYHLLAFLQETEDFLGKQKDFFWGPRTIDLDLLFFNDQIIDEPRLKVPHPLLHKRRFVLEPMCELDPDWVHPVFKKSIAALLQYSQNDDKVSKMSREALCLD